MAIPGMGADTATYDEIAISGGYKLPPAGSSPAAFDKWFVQARKEFQAWEKRKTTQTDWMAAGNQALKNAFPPGWNQLSYDAFVTMNRAAVAAGTGSFASIPTATKAGIVQSGAQFALDNYAKGHPGGINTLGKVVLGLVAAGAGISAAAPASVISGGAGQATLVGAGSATSVGAGAAAAAIPEIIVTAPAIVGGVSASTVLTGAAGLVAGTSYLSGGTAVTGQTGGLSQAPTTTNFGGTQTPGSVLSPNTGSLTYNQISGGNLQIWDGDKLLVDTLQGIAPSGASETFFDQLKAAIKTGMKGKDLFDLASGLLGGAAAGAMTGGSGDFIDKTLDDLTGGKKPTLPDAPPVPTMPVMDDRLKQAERERALGPGGRASTILTSAKDRIVDPGSRWLQGPPHAMGYPGPRVTTTPSGPPSTMGGARTTPTASSTPVRSPAPDRTDSRQRVSVAPVTVVKPHVKSPKMARTAGTTPAQPKASTPLSRPGERWRTGNRRIGL